MNYGLHADDAMMGSKVKERSDIPVTVFLNDPGDYEGGESVMSSPFGEHEIELPAATRSSIRLRPCTGWRR